MIEKIKKEIYSKNIEDEIKSWITIYKDSLDIILDKYSNQEKQNQKYKENIEKYLNYIKERIGLLILKLPGGKEEINDYHRMIMKQINELDYMQKIILEEQIKKLKGNIR